MRHSIAVVSMFAGLLFGGVSGAFAQVDNVKAWNGVWRSAKDAKPVIELTLVDGKFDHMKVDGAPRSVTDVQVSPDQKTVIFSWDGGQGTLYRVMDSSAEISLFAPKLNVRNAPVLRQQ